jgi:hypothetical protein
MIGWGTLAIIFWALGLFPTANRYPLTAHTLSLCFLIKTYLTRD